MQQTPRVPPSSLPRQHVQSFEADAQHAVHPPVAQAQQPMQQQSSLHGTPAPQQLTQAQLQVPQQQASQSLTSKQLANRRKRQAYKERKQRRARELALQPLDAQEHKWLQRPAAIAPFPHFLQLPSGFIAQVALCLPTRERLQLGRLVLRRAAPAAAAAVLSTLTRLTVRRRPSGSCHLLADLPRLGALTLLMPLEPENPAQGSPAQQGKSYSRLTAAAGLTAPTEQSNLVNPNHPIQQPAADHLGTASSRLALATVNRLSALTGLTSLDIKVPIQTQFQEDLDSTVPDGDAYALQRAGQLAVMQTVGRFSQLQRLRLVTQVINISRIAHPPAENALSPLSALTGLRFLELQYRPGSLMLGVAQLSTLTGLTELNIDERAAVSYSELHGICSENSASLEMAEVWPQLGQLQKLELCLQGDLSGRPDVPASLQLPHPGQLTALCLRQCEDFFPGFSAQLVLLTGLHHLQLHSCLGLSADDLAAALPQMADNLISLDISCNGRSVKGCSTTLLCLSKLENLQCQGSLIATDDSGWRCLSSLTSLTKLSLGGMIGSLREYGPMLSAAATASLAALTELQELQVYGGAFRGGGAAAAAVFRPLVGTLTKLELLGCEWVAPGGQGNEYFHGKGCECEECVHRRVSEELEELLPEGNVLTVGFADQSVFIGKSVDWA